MADPKTKAETIKGALARLAKSPPKAPEITKLPAEEPKPSKNGGLSSYDEAAWPVNLHLSDKQAPFITRMAGGDEAVLLIKVKANEIRTIETSGAKDSKETRATLTILEVSKL